MSDEEILEEFNKKNTLIGIGDFVRVVRKLAREYPHLDFGGITYKKWDGTEHTDNANSAGYYVFGTNGITVRQTHHAKYQFSAQMVYAALAKTILHEMAHRMVDNKFGTVAHSHGEEFQLQCFELGLNGCSEGYDSVEKFLPETINKLAYELDFEFFEDGSLDEDYCQFYDIVPEGESTDYADQPLQDDEYTYGVPSELWAFDDREKHWREVFFAENFCRDIGFWFEKRYQRKRKGA